MRYLHLLPVLLLAVACDEAPKDDGGGGSGTTDDPGTTDPGTTDDTTVDADADGFDETEDCDDNDATAYPGADELCDGIDNDCDTDVDEEPVDGVMVYADTDGDAYGDDAASMMMCEVASGYSEVAGDCNDADSAVNPDAAEVCDELDNDCDGLTDDDDDGVDLSTGSMYYMDDDGDMYGVDDVTMSACATPDGYADMGGDCDDTNAELNPETMWYADLDADTYGDSASSMVQCEMPADHVLMDGDCDDADATINPAAAEVCDELDNNCDGLTDDDDPAIDTATQSTFYADADLDGYGDETSTTLACVVPSGYADMIGDCDDTNDAVNPGATEIAANGLDDDCDGLGIEFPTGSVTSADADAVITGSSSEYFGNSVAFTDFDGDGADELLVGSYSNSSTGGTVYAFYGPKSSINLADASFSAGTASDNVGEHLAAGDYDGDGYGDIFISADGADTAYLMYGGTTAFSGAQDLNSADVIFSDGSGYASVFASNIGNLGDVDGDGTDDLVIGDYSNSTAASSGGAAHMFFSSYGPLSSAQDVQDADATVFGDGSYYWLGYGPQSLGGIGDINGDGYDDVLMGCDYTNSALGGAYLYYGGTTIAWAGTSYIDDGTEDAEFDSADTSYSGFGRASYWIGDVTGDGYDDFILRNNSDSIVYLMPGSASNYSGAVDTAATAHTTFTGPSYEYLGYAATGGDFDGDGNQDLVLGGSGSEAYVFMGPVSTGTDVGDEDTLISGSSDRTGYGLHAGDANGDGLHDLLVGAPYGGTAALFLGGDGSF